MKGRVLVFVLAAGGGVAAAQDLEPRGAALAVAENYGLQGYGATMERNLNAFGIAWQYRWGGGY